MLADLQNRLANFARGNEMRWSRPALCLFFTPILCKWDANANSGFPTDVL